MEEIRTLLETQPLFALFLTIALGYLVGEINLKGFSLGSGAVLFVGLAIGGLAPKAAPPALLGTMGLLLFLYGVGIQYGGQFFQGLTSKDGLKANVAATLGVIGAGCVAVALIPFAALPTDAALGIFAGAGTSTATLQAILTALNSDGAAVGYSVAYPFGVAIPILGIYALNAWLKPSIEQPAGQAIEIAEIALLNPAFWGLRFPELIAKLPSGVMIAACGGSIATACPPMTWCSSRRTCCWPRRRTRRRCKPPLRCWGNSSRDASPPIARIWTTSGFLRRSIAWSVARSATWRFRPAWKARSSRSGAATATCCPARS